jgi:hypothetical protein
MPARRDADALEERLAELMEEFRTRTADLYEKMAALETKARRANARANAARAVAERAIAGVRRRRKKGPKPRHK